MGKLKKFGSTFLKRTVAPARLTVPKFVVSQHKIASKSLSKDKVPFCPSCATQNLSIDSTLSTNLPDEHVVWSCDNCDFIAEVEGDTIDDLKYWLHANARSAYKNGEVYARLASTNEDDLYAKHYKVKKRVFVARVFLFIAFLFLPVFLYGSFKLNFFLMINSLLMIACFMFVGATSGYRAWQVQCNKFFADNPKAQFHYWLRNYNWFAYPNECDDESTDSFVETNFDD